MTAAPETVEGTSRLPPPPRVRGWPVVGSALALFDDPIRFLLEQYRAKGPIFRVKAAHLDYVVLAGADANAFVHDTGSGYLSASEFWRPFLTEIGSPNSIVGLEGEDHATLRRLLAPGMSKRTAENQIEELARIARESFASRRSGEDIAFVGFAQRLVSRQVGFVLTGETPSAEQHEAILGYLNTVSVNLSLRRLPRLALKLWEPGLGRSRRTSFAYADSLIAAGRERQAKPGEGNFIDTILRAAGEIPRLFTPTDVRVAGLLPFFAGVDTVGQTLAFALYELLRRPQLLQRVRDEIDRFFAAGTPSAAAFREMSALQGLVLETLRLHPTAFGMSRTATADFAFAGHAVERGQEVLVFTTVCHFLPEFFPEPERFDIDRYSAPRDEHRQPNVFAPFGRGPHACLGSSFATVQLAATLATILHHFDLELPEPDREYKTVLMPTPSLGDEFRLRFNGPRRHLNHVSRRSGAPGSAE